MAEDEIIDDEEPELSLQESLARWGIPNADGSRVVLSSREEFSDYPHADVYSGTELLFRITGLDVIPLDALFIGSITGAHSSYLYEFKGVDQAKNALVVECDDHRILFDLTDGHVIDNPLAREVRLRLVTTPLGLAIVCVLFALLTGIAWLCLFVVRKSLGKNPRLR